MDVDCWKEKLSELNLVRECSAGGPEDNCWLCSDLEAWNSVLQPLHLHLAEHMPGMLRLYNDSSATSADFQELDTPYDSAFFTVWLPRKHACVEELKIEDKFPCINTVTIPKPVASLPSKLRHISISGNEPADLCLLLDALGPTECLEELELSHLELSESLASKLAQLLLINADSFRSFSLAMAVFCGSAADILMSGLSKCGKLKELSLDNNLSLPALQDFTRLLMSTETLQELCLNEQSSDWVDHDVEINYEENNRQILAAVSHLLRRNITLTEFSYRGVRDRVPDIMSALESNDVLKCLTISCFEIMPADQCPLVGTELKSLLVKNRGLRSLVLEEFDIDYRIAGPMSEGLQQNTTLAVLDLVESALKFSALYSLCSVLGVNRTLCSLRVGYYEAEASERVALSAELARLQCYGRIQMAWNDLDTLGLSSALMDEPLRCPKVLHLNTLSFTAESFSVVCRAVASSIHLEELKVVFQKASSGHVKSACEALRENKSLKCVTLREDSKSLLSVATAAKCLISNESVTELELYCYSIDEASADMLGSLLVGNKYVWALSILSRNKPAAACVDTLSRAFVQNHFVTALIRYSSWGEEFNRAIGEVLSRNYARLRQAARFVVGKNREKVCAEAFEHFRSKEQLLKCATFISGMSDAEERAAEKAAKLFIEKNYLFINRVVCHKVECHAGRGTQIDKLNPDCWLAIVKYLKVSDVK